MSCSSNRNRLVGSCISTFVSSTNRRGVVGLVLPAVLLAWAALREAREMSWDGAGRSLRSTMVLRGFGVDGPPGPPFESMLRLCRVNTRACGRDFDGGVGVVVVWVQPPGARGAERSRNGP